MPIMFQSPTNGAILPLGQPVTITVATPGTVAQVLFSADGKYHLGAAPATGGTASLTWAFSGSGMRQLEATGLDSNGHPVDFAAIPVVVQAAPGTTASQADAATLASIAAYALSTLNMDSQAVESAVRAYAANGSDWCVSYCAWVYRQAVGKDPIWGVDDGNSATGRYENWVPDMVLWAQENGCWLRHRDLHQTDRQGQSVPQVPQDGMPQPGYLLVYGDRIDSYNGRHFQNYPHIGVVVEVDANGVRTVEGNTSKELPDGSVIYSVVNDKRPSLGRGPNTSQDPAARYVAGYIIPPQ